MEGIRLRTKSIACSLGFLTTSAILGQTKASIHFFVNQVAPEPTIRITVSSPPGTMPLPCGRTMRIASSADWPCCSAALFMALTISSTSAEISAGTTADLLSTCIRLPTSEVGGVCVCESHCKTELPGHFDPQTTYSNRKNTLLGTFFVERRNVKPLAVRIMLRECEMRSK